MSESIERPGYYAVIPAYIRYDNDLPDKAKLLYGEISTLANYMGYCFARNKYFADLYGISERQVMRLLNSLCKKEHIHIERTETSSRKIWIAEPSAAVTKMSLGGDKNVTERGDKNVTHNNININNNINNVTDKHFDQWYSRYPNKHNRQQTHKNYKSALKNHTPQELDKALDNYLAYIMRNKVEKQYIVRSYNFVGKKEEYLAWLEEEVQAANAAEEVNGKEELQASLADRKRRLGIV